jgi:hypothetical protein
MVNSTIKLNSKLPCTPSLAGEVRIQKLFSVLCQI